MKPIRAWGTLDKRTQQVTATFIGETRQYVERQMAHDGEKVVRVEIREIRPVKKRRRV